MDVKKLLVLALVVFVGFWLYTDPNGLAHTATSAAETGGRLLRRLVTSLISFFSSL